MNPPNHVKDFLKLIETFRYRVNTQEVFRDWAEIVAAELHQAPYHLHQLPKDDPFRRVEDEYLAVAKKYERKDFDLFYALADITATALSEAKQDFLGTVYMQLEISSKRLGQDFTPYEVSHLMARLNLADVSAWINTHGYVTLHEPACGSGGMLIAAAQVLEEQCQVDPGATLWFQAIDIDRLCANLTYIQCSTLGLSGVVWHGDTLRMEMRSGRYTPAARLNPRRSHRMMSHEPLRPPTLPATGLIQMPMMDGLIEAPALGRKKKVAV